jgi:hypothetical protein
VGIDWASQSHQVCLVDAHGECLGERAFAHGGPGIEELCDWLIARIGAARWKSATALKVTAALQVYAATSPRGDREFDFSAPPGRRPFEAGSWYDRSTSTAMVKEI